MTEDHNEACEAATEKWREPMNRSGAPLGVSAVLNQDPAAFRRVVRVPARAPRHLPHVRALGARIGAREDPGATHRGRLVMAEPARHDSDTFANNELNRTKGGAPCA